MKWIAIVYIGLSIIGSLKPLLAGNEKMEVRVIALTGIIWAAVAIWVIR